MNRPAPPRAHATDRQRIWRLAAGVLALASLVSFLEVMVRPTNWSTILMGASLPLLGTPLAWHFAPNLTASASYRYGRVFLHLSAVSTSLSVYGWRGTPTSGAMAFYYVLTVVFAALFFHRRDVFELLAVQAIGLAVALAANGVGTEDVLLYTLAITTTAGTGLVLHTVRHAADQLAYHDPLTGADNRRSWNAALDIAVEQHGRSGGPLSLLLVDIDHFKQVNDTEGHERGDHVLRDAVTAWRHCLRPGDTIARIGGDEFGILLPDCDADRARHIAERILAMLRSRTGETCSIGATTVRPGEATDQLVSIADAQLYAAKSAGRAQIKASLVGA